MHEHDVDESDGDTDKDTDEHNPFGCQDVGKHATEGASTQSVNKLLPVVLNALWERIIHRKAV